MSVEQYYGPFFFVLLQTINTYILTMTIVGIHKKQYFNLLLTQHF